MKKDKYNKYIYAYVLGALSHEEKRIFEDHLRTGCPQCGREVGELLSVVSLLPTTVEKRVPSAAVRERVLTVVHEEKKTALAKQPSEAGWFERLSEAFRQRGLGLAFGLAVASIVMVIGFSWYVTSLLRTIDVQESQIVALRDEVARKEELLSVLQARRVDMVIMNGLEINPQGYGKIIWDPERKIAILQISNLPSLPKDKDYQLWVIRDKKPVSAGVFAILQEKDAFFKIAPLVETDLKRINAFAVTLEPKGGVPQPTGKMYLLGAPIAN